MRNESTISKAKILIVEDELQFAADLEGRLKGFGYIVCGQAVNREKALELIERRQPDLVMLDIALQGEIDGIETANIIRDKCKIPVVFLATSANLERLENARLTYHFGYVFKPFNDRELKIITEMALNVAKADTERRKAEEALYREKKMLARTERIANIGSWELEIATGKVVWSEELFRILQMEPSPEAPGWAEHSGLIHPEDFKLLKDAVEKAITDGTPYELELRIIRKDGKTRLCVSRGFPEKDSNGQVQRLFGSLQDITERKQTEMALRESESLLNATGKMAKVGGWEVDAGTREVKWTEQMYRIHELPLDYEPSLESYLSFLHPNDREKAFINAKRAMEQGEPFEHEALFITAKGKEIWIRAICNPLIVDGKVVKLKGINQDITELKHAEIALKESESFLNTTGKMAKVGGWEIDTSTLEMKWTKQTYRILEFPLDYKPFHENTINSIHPDDREKAIINLQRALEQGEPFDHTARITTAKGKEIWMRALCNPYIVDGKVVKLKGSFQDVTELKQAEMALKESENRYRSLIELSPLGIGMSDTEGVILNVNQALASMLGYEIEDLFGQNFRDITHPEDLMRETILIESLLDNKEKSFSLEKRYRHKNGHYFWINMTVAKLSDLTGNEVFIFGFVENISNRKQMELEREKLIYELQDALAEIKELRGFLPICANCKKIRDDDGYWQQLEVYITERTDAKFSHGICPDCVKALYPEIYDKIFEKKDDDE